eukprot:TRINITY_DN14626_c0_g1_i1.p1 TRINITY_DN14626_c0_g1~~TRINITY_DN14626_c0_g1_i1.p1  ORF type:complete len:389 (+),score=40.07 TRINITY_DN14626_c0_g1_i1:117-1169(+)
MPRSARRFLALGSVLLLTMESAFFQPWAETMTPKPSNLTTSHKLSYLSMRDSKAVEVSTRCLPFHDYERTTRWGRTKGVMMRLAHASMACLCALVLILGAPQAALAKGGGGGGGSSSSSSSSSSSRSAARTCTPLSPCFSEGAGIQYYTTTSWFTDSYYYADGLSKDSPLPEETVKVIQEEKMAEVGKLGAFVAAWFGIAYFGGSSGTSNKKRGKVDVEKNQTERRELVEQPRPWTQYLYKQYQPVDKFYELKGEYSEDGRMQRSSYELTFNTASSSFYGKGRDCDGEFSVECGVYSKQEGRFAWGERSADGLYAECEAIMEDNRLKGCYNANTGTSGSLTLEFSQQDSA